MAINTKKLGSGLSGLGTMVMGVGILGSLGGAPGSAPAVLWYIALAGFLIKCVGSFCEIVLGEEVVLPKATFVVPLIFPVFCALAMSGCQNHEKAAKVTESIKASNAASKAAYENLLETFVKFYISQETEREEVRYADALGSVTRVEKIADGSTINYIEPRTSAALARQHERNLKQIQAVAEDMRAKIVASGMDAQHVAALSEALKNYFNARSNVDQTINSSAAEIISILQATLPTVRPAPTIKQSVQ